MNETSTTTLSKSSEDTRTVSRVIFSLTATLALIGNSMVLVLFARFPKWLKKKHCQCILNLAVTDILTAISLLVVPKFVQDPEAYTVPLGECMFFVEGNDGIGEYMLVFHSIENCNNSVRSSPYKVKISLLYKY